MKKKDHFTDPKDFLNKSVYIKIDRPLGSKHPEWNLRYLVNYGYVPDTLSPDGENLDAYILGVNQPIEEYTGRCIAIIHRLDDQDDKLVIVPEGTNLSNKEIMAQVSFQEKYFQSVIIRA